MPTYGWVTDTEADTYFATRMGASTYWSSGTDKAGALTTAYNQLIYSGKFNFPTTATAGMKVMQYEQALFILMEGEAIDRRAGLQRQGVQVAGAVQETYRHDAKGEIPIAPMAITIGNEESLTEPQLYASEATRDDDKDVI